MLAYCDRCDYVCMFISSMMIVSTTCLGALTLSVVSVIRVVMSARMSNVVQMCGALGCSLMGAVEAAN